MEKVSKKLVCHNDKFEWVEDGYEGITAGKEYKVVAENEKDFVIVDDNGIESHFTKEPDEDGHSYKNWFELVVVEEETEEVDE